MIPEAYKDFLNKIIEKTNSGEVKWESDIDKSLFLRTKSATIEVGQYSDDDAELSFYYFQFYNITTKKEAIFRVNHHEDEYKEMEKLYAVATASASNIKDELSNFLEEL